MSLDYNYIQSITRSKYIPEIIDNIFESNVQFKNMYKKKQIMDGGETVKVPVRYAKVAASGYFTTTDTLNINTAETVTSLEYDWYHCYGACTITGSDEAVNNGKEKVVDLVNSKMEEVRDALDEQIGLGIYCDGTTNAKMPEGLRLAAAATGTKGGIDSATYTWLQGQADSTTTTITIPSVLGKISDVSDQNGNTSVIYTTSAIYDSIENLLLNQVRYMDNNKANTGMKSINFRGIPLYADSKCPAGHLFGIDEKYWKMYVLKKGNFDNTGYVKVVNQDAMVDKVFFRYTLAAKNPRTMFMYTAIA